MSDGGSEHVADESAPDASRADHHLQRGRELAEQGDLAGAEREYRVADDLGNADAALYLGVLLKQRGAHADAGAAYRRAEERGDPRASCNLAVLLEELGDVDGAKDAYRRADERGFAGGAYGLGQILYAEGDIEGSIAANRRADELGDADGAFNLGVLLRDRGDLAEALAAFKRAVDRGHDGGAAAAGRLEVEIGAGRAREYAAACTEVVNAVNAVVETANHAVGARNMAEQRPQHEASIRAFLSRAEEHEQEFIPRYKAFLAACAAAREAAADMRAICSSVDPELVLITAVDQETWQQAGVATHILRTEFGPTPSAFIEGLQVANAAIQADIFSYGEEGFLGHVYAAPSALEPEERACPWCAETIKAAAVICRFCGRDVEAR